MMFFPANYEAESFACPEHNKKTPRSCCPSMKRGGFSGVIGRCFDFVEAFKGLAGEIIKELLFP
jgi:hypothetical protein